ncbi:MAG: hypothetical protein M3328_18325, partial [Chloroflexota bacterium]|nr:hypothetical protein [Chloroflexota bacterium]
LTSLPGNRYLYYITEKPGGSELLLNGVAIEGDTRFGFQRNATLLFVKVTPGTEPTVTYLLGAEGAFPRSFGEHGEHLVYELRTTTNHGEGLAVFVVPTSRVGQTQEAAATQVFNADGLPIDEGRGTGYSAQSPSWYPGIDAFAYTQGGSLYVREYEGSTEVKLEPSVLQLIGPRTFSTVSHFR